MSRRLRALAAAGALAFGGCASISHFHGIPLDATAVYVANVPALRQTSAFACGPTCVATVAASLGVVPARLPRGDPKLSGDCNAQDLVALAGTLGLRAYAYESDMGDLEAQLRRGRAMIVMIPQPLVPAGGVVGHVIVEAWNALGPKPAHWVVVVGLEPDGDVILHDPAAGPVVMRRAAFLRHWRAEGHLSVLLTGA